MSDNGNPNLNDEEWIARDKIASIPGALHSSAYVQRAYLHAKENNGSPPTWAKKGCRNKWLFLRSYIQADSQPRLQTVTASEAARLVGVSRRCIQNWADIGLIPVTNKQPDKGEVRRIPRQYLLDNMAGLKIRLETPAVIGAKLKSGKPVPPDMVAKFRNRAAAKPHWRKPATRKTECPQSKTETTTPSIQPPASCLTGPTHPLQASHPLSPSQTDGKAPIASTPPTQPDTTLHDSAKIPPHPQTYTTPQPSSKQTRSELIERQLREAQASAGRVSSPPSATPAHARAEPANSTLANVIEEHLRQTSEAAIHLERIATDIAHKVESDIMAKGWPRIAGIIMFNRLATDAGIPAQIKHMIRKKVFGH